MKKGYTLLLLLLLTTVGGWSGLQAQTMQIVYSDTFTTGQGSSGSQCTNWNAFRAQLSPRCYVSMTIKGTFDPVGRTCTDPVIVNAFAAAVNAASSYTSPVACGGDIWSICNRYSGEVWLNPPSQCSGANCPGPNAYIIRPCIGGSNQNWGGVNTNTCSGPTQRMEFIFEYLAGPTSNDTVAGPMAVCPGDTVTYAIDTVLDADSLWWTVPAGATIISGPDTNFVTMVMGPNSGAVSILGTNPCGTTIVDSIVVTAPAIPTITTEFISGPDTVCGGDTLIYSIPAVPDAVNYMWFGPAGSSVFAGQGTNLISLVPGFTSGELMVYPQNSCGEGMNGDTLAIHVLPEAMVTSPILGGGTFCESDTVMLIAGTTVNTIGMMWDVPSGWSVVAGQGTDTVWVVGLAGTGTVSLIPHGACGNGVAETVQVVLEGVLAAPGPITGDNSVCWQDTAVYTIPALSGSGSYTWSVPTDATILSGQGDTMIVVLWGGIAGNVSVSGENSCGAGANADFAVTVDSCLVGVDPSYTQGVQVFPNPTSGKVDITFELPMNGADRTVKVFDVNGALKGEFTADWQYNQTARLNLGALPNGVYFLEFRAGELRKTAKVVLSK